MQTLGGPPSAFLSPWFLTCIMLYICLYFVLCPLFYCASPIHMLAMLNSAHLCSPSLSHYTVLVILNMSPAQFCKTNACVGNAEQCVLAFIHLLSSNCTSYFVPFHHFICAYCKCISLVVQLAT